MAVFLVVFGAAVRDDGSPSGTLRRRCESAVTFSRRFAAPYFLATGGVGRHGPAEASVIRTVLLEQGIPADRVLVEPVARDTLEAVRFCARLLRARRDVERVLVCSSSYHAPRCVLLFRIAGFQSAAVPTASDLPHLGRAKWLRYVLKEIVATPWDAIVLAARRACGAA